MVFTWGWGREARVRYRSHYKETLGGERYIIYIDWGNSSTGAYMCQNLPSWREHGGDGNTKNLSLPPRQQSHWQKLSEVTNYFGTLESVEGIQLPRESLECKLWLVLAPRTAVSTYPIHSLMAGSCAPIPEAAYTQLVGLGWAQKGSVPLIWEICPLIADCYFCF